MRRYLPVLALASCFAAAQTPAQPAVPTFTSKTELVTVPVVVLRSHSPLKQLDPHSWVDPHVTGLKADDFQIEENGKPVKVATFEEVGSTSKEPKRVVPPPGVYTNELADDSPVSMLVIVFDTINTPYNYQQNAKKKILEFLQTDYKADRPTMLVALHPDKLRILHDFTTDPKVLTQFVQQLKNDTKHDPTTDNQVMHVNDNAPGDFIDPAAEIAALNNEFLGQISQSEKDLRRYQIDKLETTLYEMQQLAQSLSAVRGMKTLIWATGGFVLPLPNAPDSTAAEAIDEYQQVLRLMTAAGVSVYPIDVMPEVYTPSYAPPAMRGGKGIHIPIAPDTQTVQGLQNLNDIAKRTGGDYCLLRKDHEWCFKKAVDYNSHFYLLSYYTHTSEKPEWRNIKVNVRGDHLDVRARNGFFSGMRQGDPAARRKSDIAQAFAGPVDYRGLAISMRWKDPASVHASSTGDPKVELRPEKHAFILQMDPDAITVERADNNHIEFDIAAVATDVKGKILADVTQHLNLHPTEADLLKMKQNLFAYTNAIELPQKATAVKFVVRDSLNERMGTLTVPLQ